MKTPVTITMLIVGGFLLIAPFVFNALHEREINAVYIKRTDLVSLEASSKSSALSPLSRFGCWFTGAALMVVAISGARSDARHSEAALKPATTIA